MDFGISTSEEEILTALWSTKHWMTCKELMEYFNNKGKSWKRQTINTFLARLIQKGLVVKNQNKYIYAYTKEEFDALKTKEILDTFYNGSLKNFIAALSGTKKISSDEVSALKEYLDSL